MNQTTIKTDFVMELVQCLSRGYEVQIRPLNLVEGKVHIEILVLEHGETHWVRKTEATTLSAQDIYRLGTDGALTKALSYLRWKMVKKS